MCVYTCVHVCASFFFFAFPRWTHMDMVVIGVVDGQTDGQTNSACLLPANLYVPRWNRVCPVLRNIVHLCICPNRQVGLWGSASIFRRSSSTHHNKMNKCVYIRTYIPIYAHTCMPISSMYVFSRSVYVHVCLYVCRRISCWLIGCKMQC